MKTHGAIVFAITRRINSNNPIRYTFFSQCQSRYVQLNNVRLLSYNVHNGARVTHENNFAGAKNAVKHTWLVFEVKLWVVREMINRRAGKIRGREREREAKSGRKRRKEKE